MSPSKGFLDAYLEVTSFLGFFSFPVFLSRFVYGDLPFSPTASLAEEVFFSSTATSVSTFFCYLTYFSSPFSIFSSAVVFSSIFVFPSASLLTYFFFLSAGFFYSNRLFSSFRSFSKFLSATETFT